LNICLHVKYPLFVSHYNGTNILDGFSKKKYSDMKFHEIPSRGDGQTDKLKDRHDEANSRFSQFCDRF
jgi:hypothetical protein